MNRTNYAIGYEDGGYFTAGIVGEHPTVPVLSLDPEQRARYEAYIEESRFWDKAIGDAYESWYRKNNN